ncbi:MAG: tryptophan synthase subunit alpha [Lachnospiraceae bacterium]|nr:tryptophan synthase subunit alpha [Lachnospiraceae bacterium]
MNQFNQMIKQYQEENRKLFMLRMEQNVFQSAVPAAAASILKEEGFGAVNLICTDSLEKCLELAGIFTHRLDLPVVLETGFHKILKYGLAAFAKKAAEAGISGIRVPDLPFEEQGQLAVYFLEEEGPFLIREITPASGDRIIQNMQFARGFIWCSSSGNMEFLSSLEGDPCTFYLYAVEAAATLPVLLDFNTNSYEEVEKYLPSADGVIAGNNLIDRLRREGYSSQLLREYCHSFNLTK